ncbi:lipopolysaccharide-induced tumor necrosis factor-alpha factor homolog [Sebastes umbrosus]|uniref:lipopolysaccharide-induced tumor necrosis factor-alpha factor homolog n=1 Tax=Sebastes umbrosus TaxID=72105 RepID=UPI00189C8E4B|nr:lipopolysaccharide-induced tumor necrosis factor-alpha factor homolog [Sebastes umbrosus]
MESFQQFRTPPSYLSTDRGQSGQDGRIYHINSPFSPPQPPPFSFSPDLGCSTQTHSPVTAIAGPGPPPRLGFVSYEQELFRIPAVTTCPTCQDQVTSHVTYHVGRHAWLMCLVFVLCGLVLGCCLIPFFVNYFKDAYHICPRCEQVLHVDWRTCCE